jgi:hypothetical protein
LVLRGRQKNQVREYLRAPLKLSRILVCTLLPMLILPAGRASAQSVGQADHLRMLARTSQADSGDILGHRMNSLDHSPVVLPVAVPDPVPQVSPTNAPGPPPAHRRHRARNIIIVIVAVTVMYVVLASLDK